MDLQVKSYIMIYRNEENFMKAVNYSEGKVNLINAPKPTGEGVLVKINSCGICGTDIHMLDSNGHFPHIAGHEMTGNLTDGTLVAIEPLKYCGQCNVCKSGDYNLCSAEEADMIGLTSDGGMAEEIIVPEHALVKLNKEMDSKTSCLVEPIAVAVHGYVLTETLSSHRVAVVGGGSIGQCAVFAAKAMGCEVDLYARYEHQFEAAELCGVKEPSGVYDRVVDCVGSADAIQKCIELLKPQGKIIGLAVAWDDIKIPGIPAVNKEASYHTSRCYGLGPNGRDIDIAAKMLFDFNELASKIITHRFPIDDAQEAFRTAADRKSGSIKVVLDINI